MELMPLVSAAVTYFSICCTSVAAQGEGGVEVPGGITDGAGRELYLTGEKAGVVAVNAEDGSLLWECADATRPLARVDHRLAVLANEPGRPNVLRVWFLDVEKKGARAGESEPLILPEWVDVVRRRNDELGRLFELRASLVGGELHLHWTAETSYGGGAPPPPEVVRACHRSANGLAVVDTHSGRVTMRSLPAEDRVPAPDWETRVDKLPKPVKELAEGWAQARLDGARAYGRVRQFEPGGRVLHVLQVVDVATGRLLWQRPIGEELPFPPRQ